MKKQIIYGTGKYSDGIIDVILRRASAYCPEGDFVVYRKDLADALRGRKSSVATEEERTSWKNDHRHGSEYMVQLWSSDPEETEPTLVRVGVVSSQYKLRIGCVLLKGENAKIMRKWARGGETASVAATQLSGMKTKRSPK